MSIYGLFKAWHKGMIQQREFGPKNVRDHMDSKTLRAPFKNLAGPELTEKETQHLMRQKELVNLLILHSIGSSSQDLPYMNPIIEGLHKNDDDALNQIVETCSILSSAHSVKERREKGATAEACGTKPVSPLRDVTKFDLQAPLTKRNTVVAGNTRTQSALNLSQDGLAPGET